MTIVLVKTIFTMWQSNLELDLLCFSYLSLEPAFIDLQYFHIFPVESRSACLSMVRNTSQVPLFITDRLFVLFHSRGNFQRCFCHVLFSTFATGKVDSIGQLFSGITHLLLHTNNALRLRWHYFWRQFYSLFFESFWKSVDMTRWK